MNRPKMTLKKYEGSKADRKQDRGMKEGSPADRKADKAAVAKMNKGRK